MQGFILVGEKVTAKGNVVLVGLYVGQSGVELAEAHEKAISKDGPLREGEKWRAIHRLNHPMGTPMPLSTHVTKCTTPKFTRPKAKVVEAPKSTPLDKVIEEQRKKRLSTSPSLKDGKLQTPNSEVKTAEPSTSTTDPKTNENDKQKTTAEDTAGIQGAKGAVPPAPTGAGAPPLKS